MDSVLSATSAHSGVTFRSARLLPIAEMKINANIVVVLFFFFFPLAVVYMLSMRPKELFNERRQWRTYLGLLVCWLMLWTPFVLVYRIITGSI